jgi:Pyridoxamine 5'-phosphate oxidase
MTDRDPVETTNLSQYDETPLDWSRARDDLVREQGSTRTFFLGTIGTDGRPHSAGVGAVWEDGDVYVVAGPGTRKARNLEANPACTVSVSLADLDLVLEGDASRVRDTETLERLATIYRQSGWPAQVEGDAFSAPYTAPSGGPPPWNLYRVLVHTVFGVASAEPSGATKWTFSG